jgi:hypothetical protein
MRILIAHPGPGYSVADVYSGWDEALRALGLNVYVFNLDDRLVFYDNAYLQDDDGNYRKALDPNGAVQLAMNGLAAGLFKLRPEILISVFSLFHDVRTLDMARAYGTKVVMLHTESPYEDGRQMEISQHADLTLINDPTNLERFREICPTEYVPHSYRPKVHWFGGYPRNDGPDLFWAGTAFPSRVVFLEQMNFEGLDVKLGGNFASIGARPESPLHEYLVEKDFRYCMQNTDTADWYRKAKMGINFYRREAEEAHKATGWSCGPREIEMAACGLPFLRDPRGESDELFPFMPSFDTVEDASEKLRWWLDHEKERLDVAAKAYEAIKDRTFDKQASMMLRKLGF